MSKRTALLFREFVMQLKDSGDSQMLHEALDERGAGLVLYECRCGALRCAGLQLAMLDHEGNPATFALTHELCATLGAALMKVGAS